MHGKMQGVIVTFKGRPSRKAALETIVTAVFVVSNLVVEALSSEASEARPIELKRVLQSLDCAANS